jgi:hypothetical protein
MVRYHQKFMAGVVRFITISLFIGLGINAQAQSDERPLSLPFAEPASASTWLLGQPYGNTTGAFNFGQAWYSAGQGLHFGLDFSVPCGTELVAMADGIVVFVDNLSFGSRPHNLLIRHEQYGVTILYGHLLEPAPLLAGQFVQRGQIVGKSGDPDGTCTSRPHLHLEIRSLDYRSTYNPIDYIDADWHTLALIGSYTRPVFQQNLDNARQWMSLDDQPIVVFGGRRLNDYVASYPPSFQARAPENPLPARRLLPLQTETSVNIMPLGYDNCCQTFWWDVSNANTLYAMDGIAGQRAMLMQWDTDLPTLTDNIQSTPPPHLSGDGTATIIMQGQDALITDATGTTWRINTEGIVPGLNISNDHLVWTAQAPTLPGQAEPIATVYTATLDGNISVITSEAGVSARWLDTYRLLFTLNQRPFTQLDVYDIRDSSRYTLGRWYRLRGLSVAPGGESLMFYLSSQPDPAQDGVYHLNIAENATPEKLAWFGAWRWRDSESVYYIPLQTPDGNHRLHYQHFGDDMTFALNTPPLKIMNGYWEVNADGTQIAFHNLTDRNLWLMNIQQP